jgi:hypothetical protein
MQPLSQEQLFDEETRQNLQKYGIVMAVNPCGLSPNSFENGFQIISNHNSHLLEAMDWAIVELNIQRANRALSGKFFKAYAGLYRPPMHHLVEAVFESYRPMWEYFCFLERWGKCWTIPDYADPFREKAYDKHTDGLRPFGVSVITQPMSFNLKFNFDRGVIYPLERISIPVKKVPLPKTNISEYYGKEPLFDSSSPNYTPYAVDEYPASFEAAENL